MHSSYYDDSRSDAPAHARHTRHRGDDVAVDHAGGVENGYAVGGWEDRREGGGRRGGRSDLDDERDRPRERQYQAHRDLDSRHPLDPELERDTMPETPMRSHHHNRPDPDRRTTAANMRESINRPRDFGPPISAVAEDNGRGNHNQNHNHNHSSRRDDDRLTRAFKLNRQDCKECILLMNHIRKWAENCPDIGDFGHYEGQLLIGISSVILDVLPDMIVGGEDNPSSTASNAQIECLAKWQDWFGEFLTDMQYQIGPRYRIPRTTFADRRAEENRRADDNGPPRQQHHAHSDDELETDPHNRHNRPNRLRPDRRDDGMANASRRHDDRQERRDDRGTALYRRGDVEDGYGNGGNGGGGRAARERVEEGNGRLGGGAGVGRPEMGGRQGYLTSISHSERERERERDLGAVREDIGMDGEGHGYATNGRGGGGDRGGRDNHHNSYRNQHNNQHGDLLNQAPSSRAARDPPRVAGGGGTFSRALGDVQQQGPPPQTHQHQQQQQQQRAAPVHVQPTPTPAPTPAPAAGPTIQAHPPPPPIRMQPFQQAHIPSGGNNTNAGGNNTNGRSPSPPTQPTAKPKQPQGGGGVQRGPAAAAAAGGSSASFGITQHNAAGGGGGGGGVPRPPLGRGRGIDMNNTPNNNNNNNNSQPTGSGAGRGAHMNTPAWMVEQQRRSTLRRMLERAPMAVGLRNGSMPSSIRNQCFELFPELQNSVERLQQLLDQETARMQQEQQSAQQAENPQGG